MFSPFRDLLQKQIIDLQYLKFIKNKKTKKIVIFGFFMISTKVKRFNSKN